MSDEYLLLKWGTLKGYNYQNNPEALKILEEYFDEGASISVMLQKDTDTQKETLCKLIDVTKGEIINDWSGEKYTKEEAKKYVREYRS